MRQSFPAVLAAAVLTMGAGRHAAAESVNFDNVSASSTGTIFPGNTWNGKGVVFRSVKSSNALIVGQTITISASTADVMILGNSDSVSPPNFAAASGAFDGSGRNDVLMHFTSPVDSVRLLTDQSPGETPDFVRLLTLVPAGNDKYVVTDMAVGLDNAVTSPQNVLEVNPPNPVTYALFQVTTEAEGFDNLLYTHPPACPNKGAIVGACFQHPPATDWVPVGCETVDCCPGCPGPLDWQIYVDGDPFLQLLLHFDGLDPEAAGRISVEGGIWNADRQTIEVDGPGTVTVHGFALGTDPRWSAASPRISVQGINAPPAATGAPEGAAAPAPTRAVRLRVSQQVGGREISQSTLVYGF